MGGSTRLLILQGPDEDMEEEAPETVTELKEKAIEKAKLKAEERERQRKEKEEEKGEYSKTLKNRKYTIFYVFSKRLDHFLPQSQH